MSIKLLVNTKEIWEAFVEELDTKIERVHVQMEQATTPEAFYRLQGHVTCLRRLKRLRDEVNG